MERIVTTVFQLDVNFVEEATTVAEEESISSKNFCADRFPDDQVVFDNETTGPQDSNPYSNELVIILSIAISVIIFLTVIGNFLVILSFFVSKNLQTYNNYFILSLALSDLAVGAVNMPLFAIALVTGRWSMGQVFCDIFTFLDHALSHVSVVLVTIISMDRCVALSFPFRHLKYWRRRSRALFLIAIGYFIPVVIWLPSTALWQYVYGSDLPSASIDTCEPRYLHSIVFSFMAPFLFLFIPFVMTTIFSLRIVVIIRSFHERKVRRTMRFNKPTEVDDSVTEKATRTGSMVVRKNGLKAEGDENIDKRQMDKNGMKE
ncbi:muscarinic acetylcholine receptor M3-like [Diadema setosum]|uniref:muscarinic acetylcholine receptor M3-like n=1 Tax=Diadema setosum TaxID=31175 RepID=UPI003B3A177C